jgi:protein-arginine kinase
MVNEEDHLREQYIFKGFDLYKAYERLSALDDGLADVLDFAYDK